MSKFLLFCKRISNSFVSGVVIGLPIYITVSDYLFSIARVEGSSMQATLNPSGYNSSDIVFLKKYHVSAQHICRGDIVAVIAPHDPHVSFVKRVIGLPGELIRTPRYKHDFVQIPKGHCWIEGDNNRSSLDSNSFGPIPLGLIKAKATHIVWPVNRWQELKHHIPTKRMPILVKKKSIMNEKNVPDTAKDNKLKISVIVDENISEENTNFNHDIEVSVYTLEE